MQTHCVTANFLLLPLFVARALLFDLLLSLPHLPLLLLLFLQYLVHMGCRQMDGARQATTTRAVLL